MLAIVRRDVGQPDLATGHAHAFGAAVKVGVGDPAVGAGVPREPSVLPIESQPHFELHRSVRGLHVLHLEESDLHLHVRAGGRIRRRAPCRRDERVVWGRVAVEQILTQTRDVRRRLGPEVGSERGAHQRNHSDKDRGARHVHHASAQRAVRCLEARAGTLLSRGVRRIGFTFDALSSEVFDLVFACKVRARLPWPVSVAQTDWVNEAKVIPFTKLRI